MALVCPRCRLTHRDAALRSVAVADAEGDLVVDTCDRCRGLWLDVPELRALAKPLATFVAEMPGGTPRRLGGIDACPACGAETEEFRYGVVWLDRCLACGGVWLDGYEHEGLASIVARRAQQVRTYRDAPPEGERGDRVPCVACRKIVPSRDTLVTEGGAVCLACSRETLKKRVEDVSDDPDRLFGSVHARDVDQARLDRRCKRCDRRALDCTCDEFQP
jgi:Zn-finger nucleic acid-binding protein